MLTIEEAKEKLTTEEIIEGDNGGDDMCGSWHEVAVDRLRKLQALCDQSAATLRLVREDIDRVILALDKF